MVQATLKQKIDMEIVNYKGQRVFNVNGASSPKSILIDNDIYIMKHDYMFIDNVIKELFVYHLKDYLNLKIPKIKLLKINKELEDKIIIGCARPGLTLKDHKKSNYAFLIEYLDNYKGFYNDSSYNIKNIKNIDDISVNFLIDCFLYNSDINNRGENVLINKYKNKILFIDYSLIFGLISSVKNSQKFLSSLLDLDSEIVYKDIFNEIELSDLEYYICKLYNIGDDFWNSFSKKLPNDFFNKEGYINDLKIVIEKRKSILNEIVNDLKKYANSFNGKRLTLS